MDLPGTRDTGYNIYNIYKALHAYKSYWVQWHAYRPDRHSAAADVPHVAAASVPLWVGVGEGGSMVGLHAILRCLKLPHLYAGASVELQGLHCLPVLACSQAGK